MNVALIFFLNAQALDRVGFIHFNFIVLFVPSWTLDRSPSKEKKWKYPTSASLLVHFFWRGSTKVAIQTLYIDTVDSMALEKLVVGRTEKVKK